MAKTATRIETEIVAKDNFSAKLTETSRKARKEIDSKRAAMAANARAVAVGTGIYHAFAGSVRRAVAALAELGTLSDFAQQMQVTSEELQKLSRAFEMVGIQSYSIENLSTAFDRMTKETGRTGIEGFKATLEELSKIGDEQVRVQEMFRIFGRSVGGSFAPLVRQGPEALLEGFDAVMAAMPYASEATVNAGDRMADGMKAAGDAIKVAWQEMGASVVQTAEDVFGGSIEELLLIAVERVKYGLAVSGRVVATGLVNIWRGMLWLSDNAGTLLRHFFSNLGAFAKAALQPFRLLFEGVKSLAIEFGKAFVRWVTGDEADWSGAWQRVRSRMETEMAKSREVLKEALTIEGLTEFEALKLDTSDIDKQFERSLKRIEKGVAAQSKLVSGSAVDAGDAADELVDKAKKAGKEISDALRDAVFVHANSYEALKLALAGGAASGGSAAIRKAAAGSSAARTQQMESLLRDLLAVTRDGWRGVANLGVV